MAVSTNHNLGGCVILLRLHLIDIGMKNYRGFQGYSPFHPGLTKVDYSHLITLLPPCPILNTFLFPFCILQFTYHRYSKNANSLHSRELLLCEVVKQTICSTVIQREALMNRLPVMITPIGQKVFNTKV